MFTGLIRDVGEIVDWHRGVNSARFSIKTSLALSDLTLGASVACNGACLTVIAAEKLSDGAHVFQVEAGPQTLALTRFGMSEFKGNGELVNLEPALRMGDPLGGHAVSGHIDTLAQVLQNEPTGDGFWRLRFAFETNHAHYVFKKGSIAISGVSLTLADCNYDEQWCEIMLIPHTLAQTNLQQLRVGEWVEIEFDSQAKMVADLLRVMLPNQLKTFISQN